MRSSSSCETIHSWVMPRPQERSGRSRGRACTTAGPRTDTAESQQQPFNNHVEYLDPAGRVTDTRISSTDVLAIAFHFLGVSPSATVSDRLNQPVPFAGDRGVREK